MWITVMGNRCPYCQRGALFESWFGLREACADCGARFSRQPGAWVGPTVGSYGVGGVVGIVGGVLLIGGNLYFPHAEVALAFVACAAAIVSYRFWKAAWVGWLYDNGYVYPDADPP